jgi:hypothetical protein
MILDLMRFLECLLKVLFDLFYRMAAECGLGGRSNTRYLCDLNLVGRWLKILHHENNNSTGGVVILGASARDTLWNLLGWLMLLCTTILAPSIYCCELVSLARWHLF